jgi:hypothetical protein
VPDTRLFNLWFQVAGIVEALKECGLTRAEVLQIVNLSARRAGFTDPEGEADTAPLSVVDLGLVVERMDDRIKPDVQQNLVAHVHVLQDFYDKEWRGEASEEEEQA